MNTSKSLFSIEMTAMEKVAWTELLVSSTVSIVVLLLLPFLGHAASSAFALLGLVVCSIYFLRNRQNKIVVDERDLEIERKAKQRGVEAAWWFLLLTLIVIVLWPQSGDNSGFVTKTTLNWLIWLQFLIFFAAKGLVGVMLYRRKNYAP